MILDNEVMFADKLAYGGTVTELDLGVVSPGPGKPIKCFIIAHAALTGCTGVDVVGGDETGDTDAIMSVNCPSAGELIEFELPSDCPQFVTIDLAGTVSAGNFSAGIILPGAQTNT